MIQPSDIHTLTEFKRDSSAVLERLESSRRPQVLTVDGRARVVLLGVEAFEGLMALVDRAETLEGIRQGLEDEKAGRTVPLEQAMAEIRKRIRRHGKRPRSA